MSELSRSYTADIADTRFAAAIGEADWLSRNDDYGTKPAIISADHRAAFVGRLIRKSHKAYWSLRVPIRRGRKVPAMLSFSGANLGFGPRNGWRRRRR
jgi:hypothetical protein